MDLCLNLPLTEMKRVVYLEEIILIKRKWFIMFVLYFSFYWKTLQNFVIIWE